jgi:diguanylate cyclase (GGDEF)-like protein
MAALSLLVVGLAVNILRRRRAETALEAERVFLQSVIDGLPDPVFVLEPDHSVRMRNRSAESIERAEPGAPVHQLSRPLLHTPDSPCAADGERCAVQEVIDRRQPVHFERRRLRSQSVLETFEISAAPLWREGEVAGVIASAHDITELKSVYERLLDHERQLEHIAHHDPLTGLPNRLLFLDRFHQAIARSTRSHNTVALLFLDLDRFKNVNDTLGHETGDALLRQVAERLKVSVRVEDTVARLGGDEFTILIEESRENPTGVAVARKIIQALERPFSVGAHQLYAGASIGIAIYPVDGTSVERLIRNADAAMYLAKERGRGNYQFFTESLNEKAHRQLVLETRLRETLSRDGLDLNYQPIVRLSDGRIVAAEALLRWTDPELGSVSPCEFIPVAEETGLIVAIGESVLRKACLAAAHWHAIGFPEMRVAVNISARQFWHQDLSSSVRQVLVESGLPARFLELELTESLLLPDSSGSIDIVQGLRDLGVRLSLDDFGTGYSSLSYLRTLPLHTLKIAQEFVQDLSPASNDSAIVRVILSLSKMLGFEVTAEGVETAEQLEFLAANGCDFVQGHYFHKAVPAPELEALLELSVEPAEGVWG